MNQQEIKVINIGPSTYLGVWTRENGQIITSISTGDTIDQAQKRIVKNFKHKLWTVPDKVGGKLPPGATFVFKTYNISEQ